MMNPILKSPVFKLASGTALTGKWHKHDYHIQRKLGYGATGVVYLASSTNGLAALKISENGMAITSEVNVLKKFAQVQGCTLGPALLDVDDWYDPVSRNSYPFYVMEYVRGTEYLSFIRQRGNEWAGVFLLQLLSHLERLHEQGWVFGDLKPDNLVITSSPPRLRLIDVGGTTLIGRSIKEYTEFFDRGYWGLGSRRAEPTYDLFAAAMIFINSEYPQRFSKKQDGRGELQEAIIAKPNLRRYEKVLLNAIQGKYTDAAAMRADVAIVMNQSNDRTQTRRSRTNKTSAAQSTKQKTKPKSWKIQLVEWTAIFVFLLVVYSLYLLT